MNVVLSGIGVDISETGDGPHVLCRTVFAALAISRWIEDRTGWSIKKFVRTARRYRTVEIQAGQQTITAADPLPDDVNDALKTIHRHDDAH